MTGSRMEVVTLLADKGGETSNLAEKVLARLFAHQMPEVLHELVKVDSSGGYAGRFSAWDRGVAQFGKELERFDFVNLVTPEFRWLKAESLSRLDGDVLSLVRRRAVALGELGVHDDPVGHGQLTRCWLRSSFLLMPPAELRLLQTLVSVQCSGLYGASKPPEGLACSHDPDDLTLSNERLLSSRLLSQGCSIVDVIWLAARAESFMELERPLGVIPSCHVQLSTRDLGKVSLS
jgi:hypothetical protein